MVGGVGRVYLSLFIRASGGIGIREQHGALITPFEPHPAPSFQAANAI